MAWEVRFQDETGSHYGIKNIDGKPRVSAMPYTYDIAEGNVADHTAVRRFGHNADVAASFETVWNGSNLYTYLTSGVTLRLVSSSNNDRPGSSGASQIWLQGLNSNYEMQAEYITLNGTSAVTSANEYLRVFKTRVTGAGSTGYNEGVISTINFLGGTTLSICQIQEAESEEAIFTVPANNTLYITSWKAAENSNKGSEVSIWVRPYSQQVWQKRRTINLINNIFQYYFDFPGIVSEKSDVEIRAKGVLAGANINAKFEGWYETN